MIGNVGPMEIIIVAIIALIVLGPKRLPDAGRSLGRGLREFKSAISGSDDRDEPSELPVPADQDARPLSPVA